VNRRLASPTPTPACATPHDRLVAAARLAAPNLPTAVDNALHAVPLAEPAALQSALRDQLAAHAGPVLIAGTLDRRLVLIKGRRKAKRGAARWVVADLSGKAHQTRDWPAWTSRDAHLHLDRPDSWLSPATLDEQAVHRLTRPRVLLTALYHPEHFPLPRFPLAISDLARAARASLLGQVSLMDMQLGVTLEDILDAVTTRRPDVLGISATFGQHDLMVRLLDTVTALPTRPLIVAGGSLTARNERLLLSRYPDLLVARGAGEPTIQDILGSWHGDLERAQIRGVGYLGAARDTGTLTIATARSFRHTATVGNQLQTDILPELDLLDATFRHNGVAQLESSRGCTNYCSFCPRSHKGQWSGADPHALPWILAEMGSIFRRYSELSRTIYLVDEEFIGRDEHAVARALAVARTLHQAGFQWETSCRVDQVVRLDQGRDWHLDRAAMWRRLCALGLRRCLFGVESGVDSVLERFNKETTGEQNALAIRSLSALGVPTRFTYITFDHLMTEAELRATHAYQGRTDLLLKPLPHLPAAAIVDGVHDPAFVAEHATGRPLHTAISYMLVSMECLIGAAYTKRVQAAGLAGKSRPSMGRQDAVFADWRIGRCSDWAQRWVDRNFALDYMLKSLEKLLDGHVREVVRGTRLVVKDAAYRVLGAMLSSIAGCSPATDDDSARMALDGRLRQMVDAEFARLQAELTDPCRRLQAVLSGEHATLAQHELVRAPGLEVVVDRAAVDVERERARLRPGRGACGSSRRRGPSSRHGDRAPHVAVVRHGPRVAGRGAAPGEGSRGLRVDDEGGRAGAAGRSGGDGRVDAQRLGGPGVRHVVVVADRHRHRHTHPHPKGCRHEPVDHLAGGVLQAAERLGIDDELEALGVGRHRRRSGGGPVAPAHHAWPHPAAVRRAAVHRAGAAAHPGPTAARRRRRAPRQQRDRADGDAKPHQPSPHRTPPRRTRSLRPHRLSFRFLTHLSARRTGPPRPPTPRPCRRPRPVRCPP
jgi:hypothetical protein